MKIFFVDDEIIILKMLEKLLDWQSLGIEIIGTATDGTSAFESIAELHPDIVITDIRMPDMDGLTLIKNVLKENIPANFIVISGYRHFEYARNAIKYGVKDYLLKPINAKELLGIIQRIKQSAEIEETGKQDLLIKEKDITNLKKKVHDFLIMSIINKFYEPEDNIEKINSSHMVSFQNGLFQVFIIKINNIPTTGSMKEAVYSKILSITLEAFRSQCYDLLFKSEDSRIVFVINYAPSVNIEALLRSIVTDIREQLEKFGNISMTLGVGDAKASFADIADSMNAAEQAVMNRAIYGVNKILFAKTAQDMAGLLNEFLNKTEKRSLMKDIETFDFNSYRERTYQMICKNKSPKIDNALYYWMLAEEIFKLFWETMQNLYTNHETIPVQEHLACELDKCSDLNEMHTALMRLTNDYFIRHFEAEEFTTSAAIAIAKMHIKDHVSERLTLEKVAKIVYLHPVYFSLLFKRETGINFIDYVNEYRIEHSKKLLKRIDLPISEVAAQVGISDSRYFSRLFKKTVGVTPSEYRNRFAQGKM